MWFVSYSSSWNTTPEQDRLGFWKNPTGRKRTRFKLETPSPKKVLLTHSYPRSQVHSFTPCPLVGAFISNFLKSTSPLTTTAINHIFCLPENKIGLVVGKYQKHSWLGRRRKWKWCLCRFINNFEILYIVNVSVLLQLPPFNPNISRIGSESEENF